MISQKKKYSVALFLALLFHISGVIGILCTSYSGWFISNTPLNLWLMALLLVFTQEQRNKGFYIFFTIAFLTGMVTEIIGVNTGFLFGNYSYGNLLGYKMYGVPLLIGINWFVTVYCTGTIMSFLNRWMTEKIGKGNTLSPALHAFSFVFDAAVLATIFDWVLEPVAIKLGYWSWESNGHPTLLNYVCWFVISALLLIVFRVLHFNKHNQFAVHLFIIQLLFFLVLQTFL